MKLKLITLLMYNHNFDSLIPEFLRDKFIKMININLILIKTNSTYLS